jgi:hypothetical protein
MIQVFDVSNFFISPIKSVEYCGSRRRIVFVTIFKYVLYYVLLHYPSGVRAIHVPMIRTYATTRVHDRARLLLRWNNNNNSNTKLRCSCLFPTGPSDLDHRATRWRTLTPSASVCTHTHGYMRTVDRVLKYKLHTCCAY